MSLMACNVEEVLKEVQDKLDKSKKGSEEYDQLLAVKSQLRMIKAVSSGVENIISKETANELITYDIEAAKKFTDEAKKRIEEMYFETSANLELKADSTLDASQLKPYYSKMQEALENLTKIPISKDSTLALEKITKGVMSVVAGQYDPKMNSIKIAIKPTLEAVTEAVQTGVRSMYIKNVGLSVNKNIESVLANDEQFKKIEKIYPEIVKDTVSMVDDALKNKDHAVLHEYVHAAALKFMSTNPDHPAVQRINKIYKIVLSDRYKSAMQKHVPWRVTEEEYWRRDVNEFVAEALSNPSVIAGLSEIKLTLGGRLTTALNEFVDAVLKMLGIKEKSTAYEYVVDSFMAIVEAQKELIKNENKDPVVTTMDTETIKDLEAIMNKASLKNIQEMLECKAKGH